MEVDEQSVNKYLVDAIFDTRHWHRFVELAYDGNMRVVKLSFNEGKVHRWYLLTPFEEEWRLVVWRLQYPVIFSLLHK